MKQNRKTWISAGVVGVILVGGASVAAAASAGLAERAGQDSVRAKVTQPPSPRATPTAEDYVVSHDMNPLPEEVGEHWTEDRLTEAEPLPMPVVTLKPTK